MRTLHAAHLAYHVVWFALLATSGCEPGPVAAEPGVTLVVTETAPMVPVPDPAFTDKAPATVAKPGESAPKPEESTPKVSEPTPHVAPVEAPCPCGCGKVGCKCGKGPPQAVVDAPSTIVDVPFTGVYLLTASWCGNCPAHEKQAEGVEGVEVLDIDEDAETVAPIWRPAIKAWQFEGRQGRPAAVPCYVAVKDGQPVRYWMNPPRKPGGAIDFAEMLRYAGVEPDPQAAAPVTGGDGPPLVHVHAGQYGGTGCIVHREGDRYSVVTNHHVVADGRPHTVEFGGRRYAAAYRGYDQKHDLALLTFACPDSLPVYPLAAADPGIGAAVVSHGYPYTGGLKLRNMRIEGVRADGAGGTHGYKLTGDRFVSGESGGPLTIGGRIVGVVWGNSPVRTGPNGQVIFLPETRGGAASYAELRSFLGKFGITPQVETAEAVGRPSGPGNEYPPVSWSTEGSSARFPRLAMTGA